MRKMLGILLAAYFCAAGLPLLSGDEAPLRIRTIRFIINDQRYDWTEASGLPIGTEASGLSSGTDHASTKPAVLASFTELKPGMSIKESDLNRKLLELEHRLAVSGYFMNQSAMSVPSQSEEGAVLVIVSVQDGFRWQFGGGSIFAIAGMGNADGARRSWLAAAGYNLAGFRYTDELVGGKNIIASAGVFYQNGFGYSELAFDTVSLDLAIGARPHPDVRMKAGLASRWQNAAMKPEYAEWFPSGAMLSFKPELSLDADFYAEGGPLRLYGSAGLSGSMLYYLEREAMPGQVSIPTVYTVRGTVFAVLTSPWLAFSLGGKGFWNSGVKDFLEADSFAPGQDYGIRAPVAPAQIIPDMAMLVTAELRSPALTLPLGGIFNFTAYLFIFEDFAWCARPYRQTATITDTLLEHAVAESDASYWLTASGAGIRFGFAYPINVLFSFTYGFNRLGEPVLYFSGSRGF